MADVSGSGCERSTKISELLNSRLAVGQILEHDRESRADHGRAHAGSVRILPGDLCRRQRNVNERRCGSHSEGADVVLAEKQRGVAEISARVMGDRCRNAGFADSGRERAQGQRAAICRRSSGHNFTAVGLQIQSNRFEPQSR